MSNTWSVLAAGCERRWRRYRWWLLQVLVGVPGVVLLAHRTGTPDSGPLSKLWHDSSGVFFVLAATLRVWRAPEEGLPDPLRIRELHRKVFLRAGTVLLLGATLGLVADRYFTWQRHDPTARTASLCAVLLLFASPVPPLLDPLVWRLWPEPLRRSVRVARAAEETGKAFPFANPLSFDPDRGAFGRPKPVYEHPGGKPSRTACSTRAKNRRKPGRSTLHWDGRRLAVSDPKGHTSTIPIAGRPAPSGPSDPRLRPAAELVWLSHGSRPYQSRGATLLLLDADGYRFLALTGMTFSANAAAQVARAAGLAFASYDLGYANETYSALLNRLFPRRGRVVTLNS
ncbi:hypothetical protein ABIA33_006723 [Streptacidiphilus sp. MAP12-16]|uniref:hypothetical protein n=1 Tax=Streptacidiphilus sp. MAP12-16 TaxID=3156300 RepID=UPI0035122668